jgi:hypothetical protein
VSTIQVMSEELEGQIRLHLNNAQASLSTLQPRFAGSGLISAASVLSLADLAIRHKTELHGRELEKFEEYYRQGLGLVDAYWKDFGLVLLKRVSEPEVLPVQITPIAPAKPVLSRKERVHVPDVIREKICLELMDGKPEQFDSVRDWYMDLSGRYNLGYSTIGKMATDLRGNAGSRTRANGR